MRPVPRAEIDFGNGKKLTRTLNGNVATYLLMPDGGTFDIIPGVMTPEEYQRRLRRGLSMYRGLSRAAGPQRKALLAQLHSAGTQPAAPPTLDMPAPPDIAKARIEVPIKRAVKPRGAKAPSLAPNGEDQLAADTRYNQRVRYPKVAALMRTRGLTRREALTKQVYKTILDVDLDDPYLGMAPKVIGGQLGRQ